MSGEGFIPARCDKCKAFVTVRRSFRGAELYEYASDNLPHICRSKNELPAGEALKAEGMARVGENQDADDGGAWRELARVTMVQLANAGEDFNADNLTTICGLPERRNTIGGIFSWALKKKPPLIHRVGERKALRASGHARRVIIYRGGSGE